MSTEFPNYTQVQVQVEEEDGRVLQKRVEFSLNNLDYIFVFDPPSDDPQGGATLTYVGDIERGRLVPSEYAEDDSWLIANRLLGCKEDQWKDCKIFKSLGPGRDFVIQCPETRNLYEGYYSGEARVYVTITTDGEGLVFAGQVKFRQQTGVNVTVFFPSL